MAHKDIIKSGAMIPDGAGIVTIFGRTRMIKSFTFIPHPRENRLEGYMCSPEGFQLGEWKYPNDILQDSSLIAKCKNRLMDSK